MENNQSPVFPFAFVKWYSGMKDHQIEDAWKRYQREVPSPNKGETATVEGEPVIPDTTFKKYLELRLIHYRHLLQDGIQTGKHKEKEFGGLIEEEEAHARTMDSLSRMGLWSTTPPKGIDTEQSAKGGKSLEEAKNEVARKHGHKNWFAFIEDGEWGLVDDMLNEVALLYASQQQQAGWIAVEDRLPEGSGWYLVYHESGDYYLTSRVHFSPINDLLWSDYWNDITHWRPLPKPPNNN